MPESTGWSTVQIKIAEGRPALRGWTNGSFVVYERQYEYGKVADSVTFLVHRGTGLPLDQFVDVVDAIIAAEIAAPLTDWDAELAGCGSEDEAGALFYDRLAGWPFFTMETQAGFHVRCHNDRATGKVPTFPPHFEQGTALA
jgi:hypothetical protein